MKITEEDIFNYVFFPEEISSEKREYIKNNEQFFPEQIRFCKSSLENAGSEEIKLQSKITTGKILGNFNIIELYPYKNKNLYKNSTYSFVAATADIASKQSESITYSDENSKYLVRIISNKDKNTLFFFSKSEDLEQKLKITLVPSNDVFHITNNSLQFEINRQQYIQKILIEEE